LSKETIEERLNGLLSDAEYKISSLEYKLAKYDYVNDWGWRQIKQLTEEENLGLPVPRLELRYSIDAANAYVSYGLVLKHLMGHIELIPFSSTRVSISYAENLTLPHRDGAHIIHDKENLKLPAYVVYKNKYKKIPFKNPSERNDRF